MSERKSTPDWDSPPRVTPTSTPPLIGITGSNDATRSRVDDHDAKIRQIDARFIEMDADRSHIRLDLDVRTRTTSERLDIMREEIFELTKCVNLMRVWLWFAGITAVIAAVGSTALWILLTHPAPYLP